MFNGVVVVVVVLCFVLFGCLSFHTPTADILGTIHSYVTTWIKEPLERMRTTNHPRLSPGNFIGVYWYSLCVWRGWERDERRGGR